MAPLPPIGEPVLLVKRDLRQWAEAAGLAGIKRDHLVLDPGFGFGKRMEENYPLLAHFGELQQMGFPLLAGVSRKSFIGRALARDGNDAPVEERLYGTLAAEGLLILKGAHIIRTHDVALAIGSGTAGGCGGGERRIRRIRSQKLEGTSEKSKLKRRTAKIFTSDF